MTMNAARRRVHDRLAGLPGVRPVRRPIVAGGSEEFDLFYVRIGKKSAHPLVIIPGGPGAASVALYSGLRRRAASEGLDVIMVEHRGVGLSRHDDSGADLPPEALTIDNAVSDVAAVLDDAQVDTAVIYGTLVRHLPGCRPRGGSSRSGARDDPGLPAAVGRRHRRGARRHPAGAVGR